MANGNGTVNKISLALAIAIIIAVAGFAVTLGKMQERSEKADAQIVKLDEQKADKVITEGIRRDIGEIKAEQLRTNLKLDKILEKL